MATLDSGRQASLSPPEFQILLALADGEKHGYGIMQEVGTRTAGRTRLDPGTLYGAIKQCSAPALSRRPRNAWTQS